MTDTFTDSAREEGGKNMKLRRATYRHVEAEIYDSPGRK
jgi:hypothetical protein